MMKTPSILVVDDTGIHRLLPGLILRPFGWTVHETESGADVLTKLENFDVRCVLLDISMPDVSGLEVLKRIRASSLYGDVQVIAYTAYAAEDDTDRLKDLGFDALLIKPLTSRQLLETLNQNNQHVREIGS